MAIKDFIVRNGFIANTSLIYAIGGSNKVGINTTAPDATLAVNGTANIAGNLWIGGAINSTSGLQLTGAVSISNTLTVSQLGTFSSGISVTGGGTFSGAGSFGSLTVSGTGSFSSTLGVTGATTLGGTLSVTGATTLSSNLAVTRGVTCSNTITVTGAATFANTVAITGSTSISASASVGTTLQVTGATTLAGLTASTTSVSTLSTSGAATLASASVTGNATVGGTFGVTGNATVGGTLGVTGASTLSSLTVSGNERNNSLGVGTAASGIAGEIRATNNITAYYSDERLKIILSNITDALSKIESLSGVVYKNNDLASQYGYTSDEQQVGVIAQQVEQVLPQVVKPAPFDTAFDEEGNMYSVSGQNYKTVQYEKLIPLLIEGIKELSEKVKFLESKVG